MTTLSSKDHKPLSLTRRCLLTKLGALTFGGRGVQCGVKGTARKGGIRF